LHRNGRIAANPDFPELNWSCLTTLDHEFTIENRGNMVNRLLPVG